MGSSKSRTSSTTTNIREDVIFNNMGGGAGTNYNVGRVEGGGSVTIQSVDDRVTGQAFQFGSDALAKNSQVLSDALDFGSDTVRESLSNLTSSLEWGMQQNRQTVESALSAVRSSVTDDSAETIQQLVMWGGIAAAVVALAWAAK